MRNIQVAELNSIGGGCPFLDAFGSNPNLVIIMPNGHPHTGFMPPMPPMFPPVCPPTSCPPPCGPECFPPAP